MWALLFVSLCFYASWRPSDLWVLGGSALFNFGAAKALFAKRSRTILALGIFGNLGLLVYFKYQIFDVQLSGGALQEISNVALPLGISFFTFQAISYLVDIYRGKEFASDFLNYISFLSFFPQLVAGPIVRHRSLVPQFKNIGFVGFSDRKFQIAMAYILLGLAKKTLLADPIGRAIAPAWAAPELMTLYDASIATIGYGLQLYLDFSAYCEIAIGVALLFGIQLPVNFSSPYKSGSVTEFWRRWHITLGEFLRDYVYFPLGGSKRGRAKMIFALWATMLLGGIWHGVGATFLLWGAMHAFYLSVEKLFARSSFSIPKHVATGVTFVLVMLAWVPFRATDLEATGHVFAALAGFQGFAVPPALADLTGLPAASASFFNGLEAFFLLPLVIAQFRAPNVHELASNFQLRVIHLPLIYCASVAVGFSIGQPVYFLYWAW